MDTATRRFYEIVHGNSQRHAREKLLEAAAPAVCTLLSESHCIFSPESDAVLRRFLPITAAGIGTPQFLAPGYSFHEFAWEARLFRSLQHAAELGQGPAYLALRPPIVDFDFENNAFYVPQLPVFVVEFRVAARMLEKLWSSACRFIALVSVDHSAGVVIDDYIRYQSFRYPLEVVYRVASWCGNRDITSPCT
jgi:hypothetical protein